MPLVEITMSKNLLNEEEQIRLVTAVRNALIAEFENIKGRKPGTTVLIREVNKATWISS